MIQYQDTAVTGLDDPADGAGRSGCYTEFARREPTVQPMHRGPPKAQCLGATRRTNAQAEGLAPTSLERGCTTAVVAIHRRGKDWRA